MRPPPPVSRFPEYPVTAGTILLATGVTIAWKVARVDVSPLLANGMVRRGELWRIFTSTLPHIDALHLIFNCYWTWVFGTLIEENFGHARTLLIFMLLAIVGNGAEFALLDGGVGLSGVGYGLFGLTWAMSRRDRRFYGAMDPATVQLFVVWFCICVLTTILNIFPVGNIAHGMGAVCGGLIGEAIAGDKKRRATAVAITTVLVIAVLGGDTVARPWVNVSEHRGDYEDKWGYDALMADDNPTALKWLKEAVRYNPPSSRPWNNLGIAYLRAGMKAESDAAFGEAKTRHNDAGS